MLPWVKLMANLGDRHASLLARLGRVIQRCFKSLGNQLGLGPLRSMIFGWKSQKDIPLHWLKYFQMRNLQDPNLNAYTLPTYLPENQDKKLHCRTITQKATQSTHSRIYNCKKKCLYALWCGNFLRSSIRCNPFPVLFSLHRFEALQDGPVWESLQGQSDSSNMIQSELPGSSSHQPTNI